MQEYGITHSIRGAPYTSRTPPKMSRLGKPFAWQQRESDIGEAKNGGLGGAASIDAIFKGSLRSGRLNLAGRGIEVAPIERFLEVASGGVEGVNWFEVVDLTKLDLSHNRITFSGLKGMENLRSLEVLSLQHNPLVECPTDLFQLNSLKSLDISSCELYGALPNGLAALRDSLVCLVASGNGLTSVDTALTSLFHLKILRANQNLIESLPLHGPYTAALIELDLSSNRLTTLPDAFCSGCGASLETLNVSGNMLSCLPASIAQLHNLKSFEARENQLSGGLCDLPNSKKLHTLMLGRNKLTSIEIDDSLFACLQDLCVLDLSENKLVALPESLGMLASLKTLDVSMNQLSTVPVGLGYISSLTRIALDGNILRSIRPAVRNSGAEKLKAYLRTRGPPHPSLSQEACTDDGAMRPGNHGGGNVSTRNHLSSERILDVVVARSREVHTTGIFDCSGLGLTNEHLSNQHDAVFSSIKDTLYSSNSKLHTFCLKTNELSGELPASLASIIVQAEGVSRLELDNNRLTAISLQLSSSSLTHLSCHANLITSETLSELLLHRSPKTAICESLRDLDMSSNKLDQVPNSIFHCCQKLEKLSLGGNNLRNVSECPWEMLESLQLLDLSSCGLKGIPGVFHQLPVLYTLDLSNNDMAGLPPTLSLSHSLKTLRVEGNAIRSIRYDVVRGGTEKILQFLGKKLPTEWQDGVMAAADSRCYADRRRGGSSSSQNHSSNNRDSEALEAKISQLEADFASQVGASKAQQYAKKKNIKMLKAKLIRLRRSEEKAV